MKPTKAAVIGGGNSALTMAADLALHDVAVHLFEFPEYADSVAPFMETGMIEKYGSYGTRGRTGQARLALVTTDLDAALAGVELIVVAVPAYAHMAVFEALAGRLTDGQTVVISPGNWGAWRLRRVLDESGGAANVRVAETDVCFHICRANEPFLGPSRVRVVLERSRIRVAATPTRDTEAVVRQLAPIYPEVVAADNVVATSLGNDNIIGHGPLVLMNTGWLEYTAGDFMIYRDGLTPSVAKAIDAVRDERDAVAAAFGLEVATATGDTYESYRNARWVRDPCETGPPALTHRYLSEDMPYGLVPVAVLGGLVDIPTPCCHAMVTLSGIANEVDYWTEGLSLERLGFTGLSPRDIVATTAG